MREQQAGEGARAMLAGCGHFRRAIAGLVAALGLGVAAPGWAAGRVAVHVGLSEPELAPISAGLAEWLRAQLEGAGLEVEPGGASRARRARVGAGGRWRQALLGAAAADGIGAVVLADLRGGGAQSEIDLHWYDVQGAGLVAGVRVAGPLLAVPRQLHDALRELVAPAAPTARPPPFRGVTPDLLAAVTRAVAALDAGRPAAAWRELAGEKASLAVQLRAAIEAVGAAPGSPLSDRARILALRGEPEAAWALIEGRARAAQGERGAEAAEVLAAAADVLVELGRLRDARRHYEHALALASKNAGAALGLGRVLRTQRETERARKLLGWAARVDGSSSAALLELAGMEADNPTRRAALLIRAAERDADAWRHEPALAALAKARRLDPAVAAESGDQRAALHARLGDARSMLGDLEQAQAAGGPTPQRLRAIAQARRLLGRVDEAELALVEARALDERDPETRRQLGEVYTKVGRLDEAVVELERAVALAPASAQSHRALARAVEQQGDVARALAELREAQRLAPADTAGLLELAHLEQVAGDEEAATRHLEAALSERPLVLEAHPELTVALAESGNGLAAERARELELWSEVRAAPEVLADLSAGQRFDALVASFDLGGSETLRFLGLREVVDWRRDWPHWLVLRRPDLEKLDADLAQAIARRGRLLSGREVGAHLTERADALYRFDEVDSRDPAAVVALNEHLDADAVFVGRVFRRSGTSPDRPAGCGEADYLEIQLRYLGGRTGASTRLLHNAACLPAGLDTYGAWNWPAVALLAVAGVLLIYTIVCGWGTVIVDFRLPQGSKALFAVSLSKRPRKVKDRSAQRRGATSWVFEKRLQMLSRFERRLEGKRIVFRWIPSRRKRYYLTVRGPLVDYRTDRLIGDFLEERTVRLPSWGRAQVEFDLQPSECAIEVQVMRGSEPLERGRVALAGRPQSERYTRDGRAFVYAPVGEHVLLVADEARVAERVLRIESTQPMVFPVSLSDPEGLIFEGCPAAVAPYLSGDLQAAAEALEAAGLREVAQRVLARWHRERGEDEAAAAAYEAAGDLTESAALREAQPGGESAAALYEQAGEFSKAAEVYRRAGDVAAAARAFESAYDYESALECYRQIACSEKVVELLERRGEYFEAAEEAAEAGDVDRAICDLQQVDARHGRYSEACRSLAQLLALRGEAELAVEKYSEALELVGPEAFSLEELESHAKLLEQLGRAREALEVYEGIRRRDLNYRDVHTRIESLRGELSKTTLAGQLGDASRRGTSHAAPEESRYELLDELGRGGMGVVYRARDKHLGREVAIKLLPDDLREHPKVIELFEREARAAAALSHPNIVTIFDAGCENGTYFMTMECMDGRPLDEILRQRGRLSPGVVAGIGVQVAAGLEYARQKKIVHRDIKPSNLFVTRERVVKIMDFGLAKMLEEVRRSSTVIGGTPNFMAPEQAAGEAVDHRTDLYALGASFFQLVTGHPPFQEGDLGYHHRHTPAPDPRESDPQIPAEMAELILRLMEKRPEDRIQTAAELGGHLQRLL